VAFSSLVEGLSLKVTGIKCPQTSDDSLFVHGEHSEVVHHKKSPEAMHRERDERLYCVLFTRSTTAK